MNEPLYATLGVVTLVGGCWAIAWAIVQHAKITSAKIMQTKCHCCDACDDDDDDEPNDDGPDMSWLDDVEGNWTVDNALVGGRE